MSGVSRRGFLAGLLLAPLAVAVAPEAFSAVRRRDWRAAALDRDRQLHLVRDSSNESAKFCYYRKGRGWQRKGYLAACHLLRDVQSKATFRMDPKLVDVLYLIQIWLRAKHLPYVIHINSGYRTPAHNAKLKGSAKKSMHMEGKAADIRIPGVSTEMLSKLAKAIGVGGVGVYVKNGFVHVDTGRRRTWTGVVDISDHTQEFWMAGYDGFEFDQLEAA